MKKNYSSRIVLLILMSALMSALLPALANAATINAASCQLAAIQSAINSASIGDTVNVPAGSCTWSSTLTITKGVNLIGAGSANTIINVGFSNYAIVYEPASDQPFRLSSFTFDLKGMANGVYIYGSKEFDLTHIAIDNNKIINGGGDILRKEGRNIDGVVYNNVLRQVSGAGPFSYMYNGNEASWAVNDYTYGVTPTLYIEDNDIAIADGVQEAGVGGTVVWRYNKITYVGTTNNIYGWDMHGNQLPGTNHAFMAGEYYGNVFVSGASAGKDIEYVAQRGGKALLFYNKAMGTYDSAGSGWVKVYEECDDCAYGHVPCHSPNGQPMHVSDSYYWNNRFGTSGTILLSELDLWNDDDPGSCTIRNYLIAEDVDVFMQKASFDGTSGVGCGTLANRPNTCKKGVGYWATNQQCNAISDANVGINPSAPISGTLYKCTATNTWTNYYTPYTYPHPLRNEGGTPLQCTENDWTYVDGACQISSTLIRTWTKINSNCQGGVSHPATETVSCIYNLLGDINSDGKVDLSDLIIVSADFGKTSGFNNPKSDTNSDSIIDIFDIVFVASRFT